MCEKMKIFQTIQKNFHALDFRANDTTLNKHNIWPITLFGSTIVSQLIYVLYEVESIEEYTLCSFAITVEIRIYISFLSTICRKTVLYDFIGDLQAVITKSNYRVKRQSFNSKERVRN